MRITFLATSGLDDPSPRGRWLPIGEQLVRAGHEVHLLLLHPTFDRVEGPLQFDCRGVHVTYVEQMHVYGYPGQRRYFSAFCLLMVALRAALALAGHARRLRPHVIHVAKAQPINGLAAWMARRPGLSLCLDCDDLEAESNRFTGGWQRWGVRWWEDHLPRQADAVSVNTHFLHDRCRWLGVREERLYLVPNGVADWQFEPPPATYVADLRQRLGCVDRQCVLYCGAMHRVAHGLDLLLEAFARLHRAVPSARLVMVGDGDDRVALAAQAVRLGIDAATVWVGRVPPVSVPAYMSLADCTVDPVADTPAARARSPLKIVESLAQGVPVVTGDVGDRRMLLDDGRAGVLVSAGDATALADGLQAVLSDADWRERLAIGARTHAQLYRWEKLAESWMAMYR